MSKDDFLPIVVGAKTATLPDDGIMVTLQICPTEEDFLRKRFQILRFALHRDLAMDLSKGLQIAAKMQKDGPEPYQ